MPFTQQQTYNIVKQHLLNQNAKTLGGGHQGHFESCYYRTFQGLKCAAGCLIPDEKYTPAMEGYAVDVSYSLARQVIEEEGHDLDLVSQLQVVHDCTPVIGWPQALADVAHTFHLIP